MTVNDAHFVFIEEFIEFTAVCFRAAQIIHPQNICFLLFQVPRSESTYAQIHRVVMRYAFLIACNLHLFKHFFFMAQ